MYASTSGTVGVKKVESNSNTVSNKFSHVAPPQNSCSVDTKEPQHDILFCESLPLNHPLYNQITFIGIQLRSMQQTKGIKSHFADLILLDNIKKQFDDILKKTSCVTVHKLREKFDVRYDDIRAKMVNDNVTALRKRTGPVDDDYYEYIGEIKRRRRRVNNGPCTSVNIGNGVHILIPKFNGDWNGFKKAFLDWITEEHLEKDDILKKHYLFKAVSGKSLRLIQNSTAKSFDEIWQILVNFYEPFSSTYERAKTCYKSIYDHSIKGSNLNSIMTTFMYRVSQFKAACAKTKVDPFDMVMVLSFLDGCANRTEKKELEKAWEQRISQDEDRSLEKFLQSEIDHRNFVPKPKTTCIHCQDPRHDIKSCPHFTNLPVPLRCEVIRKHNLCKLCLRRSCKAVNCTTVKFRCKICQELHNTMLHLNVEVKTEVIDVEKEETKD